MGLSKLYSLFTILVFYYFLFSILSISKVIILEDKSNYKWVKKWRLKNSKKRAEQQKRYQKKHAEQINAYNRAYRLSRQKPQS